MPVLLAEPMHENPNNCLNVLIGSPTLSWFCSPGLAPQSEPLTCTTPYIPVRNADQTCCGADTVIRHKIPAALPARGAGCRDYKSGVNEGVITVKVCLHVSPVCSSLLFLLAHHQHLAHSHADTQIHRRSATCFLLSPPSVIGKCF